MELEILETVSVFDGHLKIKVADNIKLLLVKEKLIRQDYTVILPEGGYDWSTEDANFCFGGTFEVFSTLDKIVATGSVDVNGIVLDDSNVELQMMDITEYSEAKNNMCKK